MESDKIGKCIPYKGVTFRIIYADLKYVYAVQMYTDQYVHKIFSSHIVDEIFKISSLIEENVHKPVDISSLSKKTREQYNTMVKMIREIEVIYGPTYVNLKAKKKNGVIRALSMNYNVCVKTIWKYIKRYLQSGLDIGSLVDQRVLKHESKEIKYKTKTGRKNKYGKAAMVIFDDDAKRKADEIIKLYKAKKINTIKRSYQVFIDEFYSEYDPAADQMVWAPEERRPTERQFSYYLHKEISRKELDEIKTSKMEVENNKRLILGSSRSDAAYPGNIVECDAVELDLSIVSALDPQKTVGRPIMYLMIDVLTSCILAVSVSYENNSIIGLTNLLANLVDDKVELCKSYGVSLDPACWPSNLLPDEIRCDRGSDFLSSHFLEVCGSLGIAVDYAPPGMGSKKGIVEQNFHQIHTAISSSLDRFGLIKKRFDSKHHKEAMLTMTEVMKITLEYVIYHNTQILEKYPRSKDMIADPSVKSAPYQLWQYYYSQKKMTHYITDVNRNNYLFNLLVVGKANLSRRGVEYKGLLYINQDENLLKMMYEAGDNGEKFAIKYDPRNTAKIYYSDGNRIMALYLNDAILHNSSFANMTWKEYEEFRSKDKELVRDAKQHNMEHNAKFRRTCDNIVKEAETEVLPSTRNLTENRKQEKYYHNKTNPIKIQGDNELDHSCHEGHNGECFEQNEKKLLNNSGSGYESKENLDNDFLDFLIKLQ